MIEEPFDTVLVDNRWPVAMPHHRAVRPGWSWWERQRLSYLHAVVRPRDVVWDIGVEQGDISVLPALWGARVVLVEPDGGFWPNIREVFTANGVGHLVAGAIHAYVDREPSDPDAYLSMHVWPDAANGPVSGDRPTVTLADPDGVRHVTLDEILAAHDTGFSDLDPDVVTVDIDGAEYAMLLGAHRLLTEVRPIWFVSVHPVHLWEQHRHTSDDVTTHFELHGYTVQHLAFDHEQHILAKPIPGWSL